MSQASLAPLRSLLGFFFGLSLCGWLLGLSNHELDRGTVRNKFTHFADHHREYDTLFLGSSRTYRQVIPRVFDAVSAEHGFPTRSFNFGVDGMFTPEDGFVAEKIFSLQPKLRWVFVEVSLFQAAHAEQNAGSARAVYWHDWKRTRIVCQELLSGLKRFRWKDRAKRLRELQKQLGQCLIHLESFGRRTFQIGQGAALWDIAWSGKRTQSNPGASLGSSSDGFVPIERPGGMQGFDLAEYDRQSGVLATKGPRRQPLSEPAQENLEGILRLVKQSGATPALVIAPTTSPITFVPRRDMGVPLLDFSDMKAWPVLFEKQYRVDIAHLNAAGGEIYTRFLAQRWLASIRDGREVSSAAAMQDLFGTPASSLDVPNRTP